MWISPEEVSASVASPTEDDQTEDQPHEIKERLRMGQPLGSSGGKAGGLQNATSRLELV
jgi:hypothetical protein